MQNVSKRIYTRVTSTLKILQYRLYMIYLISFIYVNTHLRPSGSNPCGAIFMSFMVHFWIYWGFMSLYHGWFTYSFQIQYSRILICWKEKSSFFSNWKHFCTIHLRVQTFVETLYSSSLWSSTSNEKITSRSTYQKWRSTLQVKEPNYNRIL